MHSVYSMQFAYFTRLNRFCSFDVVLTVHRRYYVEIKCQLDATDEFLLQTLVLAQHVSGTIMPIIRSSIVLYKWLLPVVFSAVKMETADTNTQKTLPRTPTHSPHDT
jgi:hypothetical protein